MLTGAMSEASRDYITEVLNLVSREAAWLASSLLPPSEREVEGLRPAGHDLQVHIVHGHSPVVPAYQRGVIYVALASLLLGWRARRDTLCFFNVGPDGRGVTCGAGMAWNASMTKMAEYLGFRRVVLAPDVRVTKKAGALAMEPHGDDGTPKLDILRAASVVDVLRLLRS